MKSRKTIWVLAKSFILLSLLGSMSACKNKDNRTDSTEAQTAPIIEKEPTEDLFSVRVNTGLPTAIMSQFTDNSMGAALARRLPQTTLTINGDTKMVLIKGSDLGGLEGKQWLELAKVYANGGYLAIETPTEEDIFAFLLGMSFVSVAAEEEVLTADGTVVISPEDSQVAPGQASAMAERLKSRFSNIQAFNANADDGIDSEKIVSEMVIVNNTCLYYCAPFQSAQLGNTSYDEDGKETPEEIKVDNTYTPYRMGLLADGTATWLNERAESLRERQAISRRIGLRQPTDRESSINEMMSAGEEHTFQSYLYRTTWDGQIDRRDNAHLETFRVWTVHDMTTNKDYYYVQQKVLLKLGRFYPCGPKENNMWYVGHYTATDGYTYDLFYGSWMNDYTSTLNLVGSGDIRVEDAIPHTDNNSTSRTIAIGTSHSETNTLGISFGGNFCSTPGLSLGMNYSHGWTDGTSFTMSTTSNSKELKVTKNTNNSAVTWKYVCGIEMYPYQHNRIYCHPTAPDALTTDVDIQNQICWSVANPSGNHTLKVTTTPCLYGLFLNSDTKRGSQNAGWVTEDHSYTLLTPNRSTQTWYMDVTFPEMGEEGHHGDKGKLIEYLQRQFPDLYYTAALKLADQTDESENTIRSVVNLTKQLLLNSDGAQTMKDYAKDLGLSQYTIKWYTLDNKHNKYELTVKAN